MIANHLDTAMLVTNLFLNSVRENAIEMPAVFMVMLCLCVIVGSIPWSNSY